MKVTYVGTSDIRKIRQSDLPDAGLDEDLIWLKGQTIEVSDEVGELLTESMREDFKNRSDTTRDLRSVEELQEVAKEFKIKGRSSMDRDALLAAVTAKEIEQEEASLVDAPDGLEGNGPEEPEVA